VFTFCDNVVGEVFCENVIHEGDTGIEHSRRGPDMFTPQNPGFGASALKDRIEWIRQTSCLGAEEGMR